MENKPPEYKINSFEEFGEVVNKENCGALFADLYLTVQTFIKVKKNHPKAKFKGFTWVDDGLTKLNGLELINSPQIEE